MMHKVGYALRESVKRNALALVGLVVAFALFGAPTAAHAGPVVMGATYEPVTTATMNGLWRKVQGKLMPGFSFLCEEWESLEELKKFDVDMSTREITVPVDINEGGGVASVEDGGWEAEPHSPTVEEISLAYIALNKRFTVTQLAEWVEKGNQAALISSQIAYQGKKAIEAIAATYGDYFYGFSTAVLCTVGATQVNGANQVIPVTNGYGQASITDTAFILRMVKVPESIALVRNGALVEIGKTTAKDPTAGTVSVTFRNACTPTLGDSIVKANALYASTGPTLKSTDYNKGLVGVLDAALSTSAHGLSAATVPNWAPSFTDATGGRFSGLRFHKGADEVANFGGGQLNKLWMSQGVYRDMLSLYQSQLRFTDAFSLEADGEVKIRGTTFIKSRRVPPTFVVGCDSKSYRRLPSLLNKPNGQVRWADGQKIQDRLAYVFPINFVCANVVLNRANLAVWSGLAEQ